MGQTRPARTFWWDRERPVEADILRAVIFDADSALADIERDGDVAPRAGLIDLIMSLFVAGIWIGVVSTGRREQVEPMVRQLVGEGLVETLVTADDVAPPEPERQAESGAELYRLALWELGIAPAGALAIGGSGRSLRAAMTAGLPAVVVTTDYSADFTGAAAVRLGYDGADPLLADGCQQQHRRWSIQQMRARTA
jgi:beta-phosphoglucomutase-like phosphatase (HAD superfamily)